MASGCHVELFYLQYIALAVVNQISNKPNKTKSNLATLAATEWILVANKNCVLVKKDISSMEGIVNWTFGKLV